MLTYSPTPHSVDAPLATSLFQWVNNCCLPKDMSGRSDSCSASDWDWDSDSDLDLDSDLESESVWQVVVRVSTRHLTSNDVQAEQASQHKLAKPSASERIYLFSSHFYCQQFSNDYKSLISNGLAFAQQTARQRYRWTVGQWDSGTKGTHGEWGHHTVGQRTRAIGARLQPVIHSLQFVERRD